MLLAEARGVDIQTATIVTRIEKKDDTFTITTDHDTYTATSLVIATGGPSIPKMGASRFAYGVANQFGLKVLEPRREIQTALAQHLTKRLAATLAEWNDCNGRLAEIADRKLRTLGDQINLWQIMPAGSEGERTAEVTLGGVDTRELFSKTLEARNIPGLYFIGEAVDVTGHLGGFNFQWAWASGHACGQAV